MYYNSYLRKKSRFQNLRTFLKIACVILHRLIHFTHTDPFYKYLLVTHNVKILCRPSAVRASPWMLCHFKKVFPGFCNTALPEIPRNEVP